MSAELGRIVAAHEALREGAAGLPWLASRQDDALQRLLNSGLPTLRDEDWRYVNLRSVREAELRAASGTDVPQPDAELGSIGWSIDLKPGLPFPSGTATPEGVAVRTLAQALQDDPGTPLREALGSAVGDEGSAMVSFNDAFAGDALVLVIEKDVKQPLVVNWLCESAMDALSSPRLLVHVKPNARATVVEQRICRNGFSNGVTELFVDDGAQLDFVDLKSDVAASHSFSSVFARVQRDATLTAFSISLGGRLVRNDLRANLGAAGARANLYGVFVAGDEQFIDNHTVVDHQHSHTYSVEHYRGIIGRMGEGVFNGKVIVRPQSQKIDSRQSNDNILLDDSAEINTKPELQIYANDVRCSHGATVGRLDEAALFYLRSRGIAPAEARTMLLDAFARSSLAALRHDALRDELAARASASLATCVAENQS